jgi:hypothetical protein
MRKVGGSVSRTAPYCSFSGKNQHQVRKLIAGPTVFICDECVELCMDIIHERAKVTADRRGVVGVNPEAAGDRGLLIEIYGADMKVWVLPRRDREQLLEISALPSPLL